MRRIRQGFLAFCLSIQALFFLFLVQGARALPPLSSENFPNPAEIHTATYFGREVSIQADFDGDHRPDLLTGHFIGGAYRIEIRLSSDSSLDTSRFLINGGLYGMAVMALDVDGDNDLDLVVTDGFSLFPKAVWLGDGKGHFENGDPLCWLGSFALGQATTYRTSHEEGGPTLSGLSDRLPLEKPSNIASHFIIPAREATEQKEPARGREWLFAQIAVRAPPLRFPA